MYDSYIIVESALFRRFKLYSKREQDTGLTATEKQGKIITNEIHIAYYF